MPTKPTFPSVANTSDSLCPAAAFLFNEATGTIAHEVVNGGSAIISGGATWGTGGYGPTLTLDGSALINYLADAHVNGQTNMTVVAGFRHATAWSTTINEYFANKVDDYYLNHSSDGYLRLWYYSPNESSGTQDTVTQGDYVIANTADHIVAGIVTSDAASNFYLDGSLHVQPTVQVGNTPVHTFANPLVMGGGLVGNLDFVYIYDRPLSGSDITALQATPFRAFSAASVAPTTITVTGPTSGTVGISAGPFTVTLNQPAISAVAITFTAATITGTFATTPVTIASGSSTGTFSFTPSTAVAGTLTASASGLASGTLAFTGTAPIAPTSITLSGASTATVNVASGTITATLDHPATASVSVALAVATIAGTFAANPITIAMGQTAGTFTFTASTIGTGTITASSSGLTSGTRAFTSTAVSTGTVVESGSSFATGLTTVNYQLYQGSSAIGSPVAVAEQSAGSGLYFADVTIPDRTQNYRIVWSSGVAGVPCDGDTYTAPVVLLSILSTLATLSATVTAGVTLAPGGIDPIQVEPGMNARQALSVIAAAFAGELSGVLTNAPQFQGAGNPGVTRISSTTTPDGRTTVVLTLPS